MKDNNEQNTEMSKGALYFTYGVAAVMVSAVSVAMYPVLPVFVDLYQHLKQRRYAIRHLDPQAIDSREQSFPNCFINYEDSDKDGDYESYLSRKNIDGEFAKITIQKDLEGKIEFTNLSETTVNPFLIPEQPYGMKVDYIDLDDDGTLESITYFGSKDNLQPTRLEVINGEYVLSRL